jgi:hypothetical protein
MDLISNLEGNKSHDAISLGRDLMHIVKITLHTEAYIPLIKLS